MSHTTWIDTSWSGSTYSESRLVEEVTSTSCSGQQAQTLETIDRGGKRKSFGENTSAASNWTLRVAKAISDCSSRHIGNQELSAVARMCSKPKMLASNEAEMISNGPWLPLHACYKYSKFEASMTRHRLSVPGSQNTTQVGRGSCGEQQIGYWEGKLWGWCIEIA